MNGELPDDLLFVIRENRRDMTHIVSIAEGISHEEAQNLQKTF